MCCAADNLRFCHVVRPKSANVAGNLSMIMTASFGDCGTWFSSTLGLFTYRDYARTRERITHIAYNASNLFAMRWSSLNGMMILSNPSRIKPAPCAARPNAGTEANLSAARMQCLDDRQRQDDQSDYLDYQEFMPREKCSRRITFFTRAHSCDEVINVEIPHSEHSSTTHHSSVPSPARCQHAPVTFEVTTK